MRVTINYITGIYNWLKLLPIYFFVPLVLIVDFLIFSALSNLLSIESTSYFTDHDFSIVLKILIIGIIAPLLETLLLQSIPIRLTLYFKPDGRLTAILISAIIFGLLHYYSIFYIIYGFLGGLLFATVYMICKDKRNHVYAYFIVVLLHSIWNTIGIFTENV